MCHVSLRHLENITGIRAHTFRTWEQRYDLLKNIRESNGWRAYTIDQTRLLLNITLLNRAGYKISDIAKMHTGRIAEQAALLATDALKQQKAVHALFLHMLALEPDSFEMVLDSCVQYWGLPKTLTAVLLPFVEKTGLLQPSGNITAANLVRNLIRHKLIAGIEQLPPPPEGSDRALLFLPPKQHHELALLYMYYLLKQQGTLVLYLGANVPVEQVKTVADLHHFKAFFSCCCKHEAAAGMQALDDCMKMQAPKTRLFVLDAANQEPLTRAASGIVVFNSVHDAPLMMEAPATERDDCGPALFENRQPVYKPLLHAGKSEFRPGMGI